MSATKFVAVAMIALCLLMIAAPAASAAATSETAAKAVIIRHCWITEGYVAGHTVTVDHIVVRTPSVWYCI